MDKPQLSLSDDVYQGLLAAAAIEGVSPEDWIATHLPPNVKQPQPVTADISDLIGSVDSRQRIHPLLPPTPFEEILLEKMAKQGVHLP